jgi:glycosyltransferase involved in cell wall biosynthesis
MGLGDMSQSKPAIHQLLTSISYGDAIGNYALLIQDTLRKRGFDSEIFVELIDPKMAGRVRRLDQYLPHSAAESILIFHFSIGSDTSRLAFHLPDKIIMIYHNITPSSFFEAFHPHLTGLLYHGRRELAAFSDRCALALGDSEYNRRELEELGFARTGVLPVRLDFDRLDIAPNDIYMRLLNDGKKNFLFVGRVIPNKKFEDLIKIFACFQKYIDGDARLILTGEYRGFERYYDALQNLISELSVKDVLFTGHVRQDELVACYRSADIFLCMSEHEGFCVPLLEAFHCRIPVIAFHAAAVPDTMRGGGLLVEDKSPAEIAELAAICLENEAFRLRVLAGQDEALKSYRAGEWTTLLFNYIEKAEAYDR